MGRDGAARHGMERGEVDWDDGYVVVSKVWGGEVWVERCGMEGGGVMRCG